MIRLLQFRNHVFNKKELKEVLAETFLSFGLNQAGQLSDTIKELGFHYSTQAGISISIEDLKVTPLKILELERASLEIKKADLQYNRGEISIIERYQQVINTWNNTSEIVKRRLINYFTQTDPLNPIYLMAFSGARGNVSQVRQLVGMRGLISDPNGQIIDIPIVHNFREGLTVTDYIMSSYGARKGVVDTALKTADSGYLTRRLVDVAQDIVISELDCQTSNFVALKRFQIPDKLFKAKLVGRTLASKISYDNTNIEFSLEPNTQLNQFDLTKLFKTNFKTINVRSPLTCYSTRSVCQLCYGWNLASSNLIDLGEAVGIIAAQSIGEPGTQLTMRTFHTGGIFTVDSSRQVRASFSGFVSFIDPLIKFNKRRMIYGKNVLLLEQPLALKITNYKNKSTTLQLEAKSKLFITDGSYVGVDYLIAELPVLNQQTSVAQTPLLAPITGKIIKKFDKDLIWILAGHILNIPLLSLTTDFKNHSIIRKEDTVATIKLKNRVAGTILLDSKNNGTNSTSWSGYSIFNFRNVLSVPLFYDPTENQIYYITKDKILYQVNINNKNLSSLSYFAKRSDSDCIIPMGGHIFKLKTLYENLKIIKSNTLKTLLYIPFEKQEINKPINLIQIKNGSILEQKNIHIVSNFRTHSKGFFMYNSNKAARNYVKFITITPANVYEYLYKKLPKQDLAYLLSLNLKLLFPGELLLDEIPINSLSVLDLIVFDQQIFILIRPVIEYNNYFGSIKESISNKLENLNPTREIVINPQRHALLKGLNSFPLTQTNIKINNYSNLYFIRFRNKIILPTLISINQFRFNIFNLNLISKNTHITFCPYVAEFSKLEKSSIIGRLNFGITFSQGINIKSIKTQKGENPKLFVIPQEAHHNYFSETKLDKKNLKLNHFLKVNDIISTQLKTQISGYATFDTPFTCSIHQAAPIFITPGMQLNLENKNLIFKGEPIGIIKYEQVVTGDIIQGLPRVEEIFEARAPKTIAQLSLFPGILVSRQRKKKTKSMALTFVTTNPYSSRSILKQNIKFTDLAYESTIFLNDFVNLGQPLTNGTINPHHLLKIFYDYYCLRLDAELAAFLSFKYLQFLLVVKVQQVYNSQGVTIADKHLEIIVRQITSKVEITHSGSTSLLKHELLNLHQITYINRTLMQCSKVKAQFKPIFVGITRTSLLTDSFISAASFQETTRILTKAAIEGKIDWLRGLKENVILGRLIPVGQGFGDNSQKKLKKLKLFKN